MAYFYNSESVDFSQEMSVPFQFHYDFAGKVYISHHSTPDGRVQTIQMSNIPGTDIYRTTSQSILTGKLCFLATFSLTSGMNYVSLYTQK